MRSTIKDRSKHGTNQYRLNYAKGLAANILENVNRIEAIWQLSKGKNISIDEEVADNLIKDLIDDTEMAWVSLKRYLEYRDDLGIASNNNKGDE